MSNIAYISHLGDTIELESELATVQTAESIRGSEWIFNTRRSTPVNLRHTAQEAMVECYVSDKRYLQRMQDVFDSDCVAEQPGTLQVQGWEQKAYVTRIDISEINQRSLTCKLTIQLISGTWTHAQTYSGKQITNSGIIPADFKAIITGACTNPTFTIADNTYTVNTEMSSTGTLEIDTREHIIQYKDGRTLKSCFNLGERGTGKGCGKYIFEPIPNGAHTVKTSCDIAFTIYEERSGLPWSH